MPEKTKKQIENLIPEVQLELGEYEFTVFAPVKARLRMRMKAASQEEACRKLLEEIEKPSGGINLHEIFDRKTPKSADSEWIEIDESSDLGVFVDQIVDGAPSESGWYGFNGSEPVLLTEKLPMFGLAEFLKAQDRIKELKAELEKCRQAADKFNQQLDAVLS